MDANWIVSANASRARFFAQENLAAPLEEIEDMVNEAVRLRMIDNGETDRIDPRSGTKSRNNTGGAIPSKTYEPQQTPDKHEAERFARDIASFLLKAWREGRFQRISLVVSPQFLGMLRPLLDPGLESAVSLEIDKDYTNFSPEQLREQIGSWRAGS